MSHFFQNTYTWTSFYFMFIPLPLMLHQHQPPLHNFLPLLHRPVLDPRSSDVQETCILPPHQFHTQTPLSHYLKNQPGVGMIWKLGMTCEVYLCAPGKIIKHMKYAKKYQKCLCNACTTKIRCLLCAENPLLCSILHFHVIIKASSRGRASGLVVIRFIILMSMEWDQIWDKRVYSKKKTMIANCI